jgi:energy-coupling factor transporter ATP-binding protein EcfA2
MNEQLIVKNFGPIKDATVDFKRVTVFIGPTGGGKSTLAKLAAIFRDSEYNLYINPSQDKKRFLSDFSLTHFHQPSSDVFIRRGAESILMLDFETGGVSSALSLAHHESTRYIIEKSSKNIAHLEEMLEQFKSSSLISEKERLYELISETLTYTKLNQNILSSNTEEFLYKTRPHFFPSNRNLLPAVEYSWAGLLRDDIGLPKDTLEFANDFSLSRKGVSELDIPFLNAKYIHRNGQDFIQIPESETLFRLYETASGIQSVTPLLVLLEHLSRNTEQAQSFIIEEPELNLYPTAQQGLLNWLVEKCTKGENDLTITTHSPYILSSCNLLLEAYKVAQLRPDLEEEIAAIVPKACWLNPDEFAAYYVADGTVKPITDDRTHLIGGNELDAVSGDISDSFRKLLRLKKQAL